MSNQENAVDIEQEEIDHDIMMGEALERLMLNPDFKTIVLNGYLEQKVLASMSLLAVPQIQAQGRRPGVIEDMISASNLKYYFQMISAAYAGALDPILSDEEEAELEDEGAVH